MVFIPKFFIPESSSNALPAYFENDVLLKQELARIRKAEDIQSPAAVNRAFKPKGTIAQRIYARAFSKESIRKQGDFGMAEIYSHQKRTFQGSTGAVLNTVFGVHGVVNCDRVLATQLLPGGRDAAQEFQVRCSQALKNVFSDSGYSVDVERHIRQLNNNVNKSLSKILKKIFYKMEFLKLKIQVSIYRPYEKTYRAFSEVCRYINTPFPATRRPDDKPNKKLDELKFKKHLHSIFTAQKQAADSIKNYQLMIEGSLYLSKEKFDPLRNDRLAYKTPKKSIGDAAANNENGDFPFTLNTDEIGDDALLVSAYDGVRRMGTIRSICRLHEQMKNNLEILQTALEDFENFTKKSYYHSMSPGSYSAHTQTIKNYISQLINYTNLAAHQIKRHTIYEYLLDKYLVGGGGEILQPTDGARIGDYFEPCGNAGGPVAYRDVTNLRSVSLIGRETTFRDFDQDKSQLYDVPLPLLMANLDDVWQSLELATKNVDDLITRKMADKTSSVSAVALPNPLTNLSPTINSEIVKKITELKNQISEVSWEDFNLMPSPETPYPSFDLPLRTLINFYQERVVDAAFENIEDLNYVKIARLNAYTEERVFLKAAASTLVEQLRIALQPIFENAGDSVSKTDLTTILKQKELKKIITSCLHDFMKIKLFARKDISFDKFEEFHSGARFEIVNHRIKHRLDLENKKNEQWYRVKRFNDISNQSLEQIADYKKTELETIVSSPIYPDDDARDQARLELFQECYRREIGISARTSQLIDQELEKNTDDFFTKRYTLGGRHNVKRNIMNGYTKIFSKAENKFDHSKNHVYEIKLNKQSEEQFTDFATTALVEAFYPSPTAISDFFNKPEEAKTALDVAIKANFEKNKVSFLPQVAAEDFDEEFSLSQDLSLRGNVDYKIESWFAPNNNQQTDKFARPLTLLNGTNIRAFIIEDLSDDAADAGSHDRFMVPLTRHDYEAAWQFVKTHARYSQAMNLPFADPKFAFYKDIPCLVFKTLPLGLTGLTPALPKAAPDNQQIARNHSLSDNLFEKLISKLQLSTEQNTENFRFAFDQLNLQTANTFLLYLSDPHKNNVQESWMPDFPKNIDELQWTIFEQSRVFIKTYASQKAQTGDFLTPQELKQKQLFLYEVLLSLQLDKFKRMLDTPNAEIDAELKTNIRDLINAYKANVVHYDYLDIFFNQDEIALDAPLDNESFFNHPQQLDHLVTLAQQPKTNGPISQRLELASIYAHNTVAPSALGVKSPWIDKLQVKKTIDALFNSLWRKQELELKKVISGIALNEVVFAKKSSGLLPEESSDTSRDRESSALAFLLNEPLIKKYVSPKKLSVFIEANPNATYEQIKDFFIEHFSKDFISRDLDYRVSNHDGVGLPMHTKERQAFPSQNLSLNELIAGNEFQKKISLDRIYELGDFHQRETKLETVSKIFKQTVDDATRVFRQHNNALLVCYLETAEVAKKQYEGFRIFFSETVQNNCSNEEKLEEINKAIGNIYQTLNFMMDISAKMPKELKEEPTLKHFFFSDHLEDLAKVTNVDFSNLKEIGQKFEPTKQILHTFLREFRPAKTEPFRLKYMGVLRDFAPFVDAYLVDIFEIAGAWAKKEYRPELFTLNFYQNTAIGQAA